MTASLADKNPLVEAFQSQKGQGGGEVQGQELRMIQLEVATRHGISTGSYRGCRVTLGFSERSSALYACKSVGQNR